MATDEPDWELSVGGIFTPTGSGSVHVTGSGLWQILPAGKYQLGLLSAVQDSGYFGANGRFNLYLNGALFGTYLMASNVGFNGNLGGLRTSGGPVTVENLDGLIFTASVLYSVLA